MKNTTIGILFVSGLLFSSFAAAIPQGSANMVLEESAAVDHIVAAWDAVAGLVDWIRDLLDRFVSPRI